MPSETIDGRYGAVATGFRGYAGQIIVLARAKEDRGLTAVCAAYFTRDGGGGPSQFVDAAAKGSKVVIGGDVILVGIGFANRLANDVDPDGESATCVGTNAPWKASYEGQPTVVDIVPRTFRD